MTTLSDKCRAGIKAAAPDLTDIEVDEMTKRIIAKAAELRRAQAMVDDPTLLMQATAKLKEEEKIAALVEKRSRAIGVIRKKERFAFYDANATDEAGAIQALVAGKEGSQEGYARSTEALIHAETNRFLTSLSIDLEKAGLHKVIPRMSRSDLIDVTKEMRRATGGREEPTGNANAEALGKLYAKYLNLARERRNDAGAWTRELEGFITRQAHDQFKVRGKGDEASFRQWADYIGPRLDERTFEDIGGDHVERLDYLRATWRALSTGVHLKAGESDWLGGFKGGSASVAKRASQERSIHFKDATAFFEYNEKFGPASIHETVMQSLVHVSRDIGLMKIWGTNPKAAFEADVAQLKARAMERGDLKQIDALSGKSMAGRLMLSLFDQVDGTASIAGNPTFAKWGRNIRAYETFVKLTGGVFSSFADLASRAGTMRWNGQGVFESYGKSLMGVLSGRPDLEVREILTRIGAVSEGVIGDIAARFNVGDKLDGRMAKLVRFEQTINGQRWWTDTLLAQTTKDLSTTLGFHRETAFADLPDRLKTTLGRFGINESHWDYARANTLEHNGTHFVVSDAIKFESDDVIKKMIGKADASEKDIARFKERFEDTWRSYFVATTRESMTEPTAMVRSMATWGSQPGTMAGEVARFVMQFKSYPLAAMTTHLNRELNRGASPDVAGLISMILGMTALGYLSGLVKDTLRNKSPKEIHDTTDAIKVMTDAFVRGGGAGLLGDVIFQDYNRSGTASGWNLVGPTAGSFADVAGLLQAYATEGAGVKDHNLASKTIGVVSNHLPMVNLAYVKGVYEFLILHGLQESVNPGYMGRMQRRLERENHQHWLVPPG